MEAKGPAFWGPFAFGLWRGATYPINGFLYVRSFRSHCLKQNLFISFFSALGALRVRTRSHYAIKPRTLNVRRSWFSHKQLASAASEKLTTIF